jgi:tripartite-type tricarboxylate transporter receptor subunit TctC
MSTYTGRLIYLCLVLTGALPLAAQVPSGSAQTAGPPGAAATAQTVADFYRGQTITVVVAFGQDSEFDAVARLLARYLGKYLPGEPDVIVENMTGPGGLRATNYIYNEAPPDGLTIGTFDLISLLVQLLGVEGVQFAGPRAEGVHFDSRRFGWLGSAWNEATLVCTLRADSPYTTADALMRQDLPPAVIGATPGGRQHLLPKVLSAALGMNLRVVNYQGSAAIRLAMERGEVDGYCRTYALFLLEPWGDTNFVRIPIYSSDERNLKLEEQYPEATLAEDLTNDPQDKQLLRLLSAGGSASRFFVAPPGVPPERLQALQDAFWAAMQDEDLQREAEQAWFEFFEPKPAATVIEIVNDFLDMPVDIVERLRDIRAN